MCGSELARCLLERHVSTHAEVADLPLGQRGPRQVVRTTGSLRPSSPESESAEETTQPGCPTFCKRGEARALPESTQPQTHDCITHDCMHRRVEILRRGGPPPHCYPISRGNLGRPGRRWRTEQVSERHSRRFSTPPSPSLTQRKTKRNQRTELAQFGDCKRIVGGEQGEVSRECLSLGERNNAGLGKARAYAQARCARSRRSLS